MQTKTLKIWSIRLSLLMLPFLVGAAGGGLENTLTKVTDLLKVAIQICFVLVTLYFFFGVMQYILASGDETKVAQGRMHMMWGIVGMAVMLAAWGLVNMVISYFGIEKSPIPTNVGQ